VGLGRTRIAVDGLRVDDGLMLHIYGLCKAYGRLQALQGVDLDAQAGEIVALLGPNGAGKTTLVSIVAGLRKADSGVVEVDGMDALRRSADVRRRIGLAPQDLGMYPVVSVRHNLQLFGELAGVRRTELKARIDEVAEGLAITDLLDRKGGELSGGQKRRVHTAIALLHRPRLLLLDEATTGADVETRGHILELVRELAAGGSAVLYSTHYLTEVETLGSNAAFLDHGRVIARGAVRELIAAHAEPVVELVFEGDVPPIPVRGAAVDGQRVRIPAPDPAATLVEVIPQVPPGALSAVEIVRPSLESVYLTLTGRRYDEADREGAPDEEKEGKRSVTTQ